MKRILFKLFLIIGLVYGGVSLTEDAQIEANLKSSYNTSSQQASK